MDIKGYENYTIDLDGNVWSKKRSRFLRQQINSKGYYRVMLYKNKKSKWFPIHRLMGITYLPNIFNKPTIDHKNQNKSCNRLFNLKWATYEENNQNIKYQNRNTTGYRNICIHKKKGYQLEIIRNKKLIVKRYYSPNKWTIEQVVKIRDDYLKELDISTDITLAHHITTLNRTTPRPINPRKTDSEKSTST